MIGQGRNDRILEATCIIGFTITSASGIFGTPTQYFQRRLRGILAEGGTPRDIKAISAIPVGLEGGRTGICIGLKNGGIGPSGLIVSLIMFLVILTISCEFRFMNLGESISFISGINLSILFSTILEIASDKNVFIIDPGIIICGIPPASID